MRKKAWTEKAIRSAARIFAPVAPAMKYHSCVRKVRYRKDSAILAAIRLEADTSENFDAYECVYCDGWHVGHSMVEPKE